MHTSAPAISVLVPVYNQERIASALLSSLAAQDFDRPYEVLLCDDGSSDGLLSGLRTRSDLAPMDLRYIWQPDRGFRVARSRNNGIRCAQGELLIFVDGDSLSRPFFLREHWEAHQVAGRVVYGGREFVSVSDDEQPLACVGRPANPDPAASDLESHREWLGTSRPWMACITANLSVRRADCVLFDEGFDGWGSEDRDFAYRLWAGGLGVHVLARTGLLHVGEQRRLDWHPLRGGGSPSLVAALRSKLHLHRKYPGEEMAPTLDLVRYCHLDRSTGEWRVGDRRSDLAVAEILAEFEGWMQDGRWPLAEAARGTASEPGPASPPVCAPVTGTSARVEIAAPLEIAAPVEIAHVRHRLRPHVAEAEVAWAIQLHRSRDQVRWCLQSLRGCYPRARVVLITDGDDQAYEDIADEFGCTLIRGEHLMQLQTAHLYVERLLRTLLEGDEPYLFRIDPDTKVCRRFSMLPAFSSMFGTLETLTSNLHEEIGVPANVQGGCIGMTRDAAAAIVSSGVLAEQSCAVDFRDTWARCRDMVNCASRGAFCDDFVLSWAAHQCGIPIVQLQEIRSRWRGTPVNDHLRFAVTHPHKLSIAAS